MQLCSLSNVQLTFVFRITAALAQGLWDYSSMPTYIFLLEGSTKAVGLVEGAQGCCTALFGLPAGYLADKWRRDSVLKVTGLINALAIATVLAALAIPKSSFSFLGLFTADSQYALLAVGLCLWGAAYGSWPVTDALFADSVPSGQRDSVYTQMYSLCFFAAALGPLLAALLFYLQGNVWKLGTLRLCIAVGMGLAVVPCLLSFLFDDDKALGAESAAVTEPLLKGTREGKGGAEEGAVPRIGKELGTQEQGRWLTVASVPYIMAVSDCLYGLASGCTIKFFPIFFLREVQLGPLAVNVVTALVPLLLAGCSFAAHPLAKLIGRVQAIVLVKLLGALLLAWMGLDTGMWSRKYLVLGVYLLRTACNNSTYALQKSILADFVSKAARAKWASLDSLFVFGWSGSAMVGGYIVDSYGFDWAFLSTAALQLVAWSVLLLLLPLVPRQLPTPAGTAEGRQQQENSVEGTAAVASAVAAANVGSITPIGPSTETGLPVESGFHGAAERAEADLEQGLGSGQGVGLGQRHRQPSDPVLVPAGHPKSPLGTPEGTPPGSLRGTL